MKTILASATLFVCLGLGIESHAQRLDSADYQLRRVLLANGITPLDRGPAQPLMKVRLGQLLFFDKELSGNRDTACATCHHPSLFSADGLCLSIGTGGVGLGPDRIKPASLPFVARNATDVFNRGSKEWTTMFWDIRVTSNGAGSFSTPAHELLPSGLDSILAAQAMFPITGRDEMRGLPGDPGNEISVLADTDFRGIWSAVMKRILAIPGYRRLFSMVYPRIPLSKLGYEHAANAIAAFESVAFSPLDSPWDRYVAGELRAIEPSAKRGALLFYGAARCASCHSGNLFTDQRAHDIAVPQLGPGKPPSTPFDFGFENISKNKNDRFRFRTPPLRNVAATGPWMHNGAYETLEGTVLHCLNPINALLNFDVSQLPPEFAALVRLDTATDSALIANLDPIVTEPLDLSTDDFSDLMAFLHSLTSPSLGNLNRMIPEEVPSGLPVDRF